MKAEEVEEEEEAAKEIEVGAGAVDVVEESKQETTMNQPATRW